MAKLEIFHPRTYQKVGDLDVDMNDASYQEAAFGSLEGKAFVKVTAANRELLESFGPKSHFVRVSPDSGPMAGSVIDDATIDKGVCTIDIIGFLEHLGDVPAVASHKATAIREDTVVPEEDPSWSKLFYAENTVGLLRDIFRNLEHSMIAQGFTPFFRLIGVDALIAGNPQIDFAKNYRINSLEIPNMGDVYEDLTKDDDFLPIQVTVSQGPEFFWELKAMTAYELTVIDESSDPITGVVIERGDRDQSSMSLASGSDPSGNSLISMLPFREDVAYSASFAETSAKSALNIARANRANIAGANQRLDQITFTLWDSSIPIFGAVQIAGKYLPRTWAIITQKAIEGQSVTYTGTIVASLEDGLIPGVTKPTDDVKRLIIEPAKMGNMRSRRQGLQKQNPTGWR